MTIRFHCSDCGVSIKAPANRSGAQLPCPKCGAQLTVPEAEQVGTADDEAAQFANLVSALESSPENAPSSTPSRKAGPSTPPSPIVPPDPDESSHVPPPAAPTVSYEPAGKGQVRIVDIKLPFASVLRLGIQFWVVGLLGALVFCMIVVIVSIVARAVGLTMSFF